jgi:hypothetical protein
LRQLIAPAIIAGAMLFAGCQEGNPTEQKPDYSLEEGTYIRLLYPNGGEQIAYGSTITVEWLMDINTVPSAMVAVLDGSAESSRINGCEYSNEAEWFHWPADTASSGVKRMRVVDDSRGIVHCALELAVEDTVPAYDCAVTYEGANMKFRVFDPYGGERGCPECFAGDKSDAPFAITGKNQ